LGIQIPWGTDLSQLLIDKGIEAGVDIFEGGLSQAEWNLLKGAFALPITVSMDYQSIERASAGISNGIISADDARVYVLAKYAQQLGQYPLSQHLPQELAGQLYQAGGQLLNSSGSERTQLIAELQELVFKAEAALLTAKSENLEEIAEDLLATVLANGSGASEAAVRLHLLARAVNAGCTVDAIAEAADSSQELTSLLIARQEQVAAQAAAAASQAPVLPALPTTNPLVAALRQKLNQKFQQAVSSFAYQQFHTSTLPQSVSVRGYIEIDPTTGEGSLVISEIEPGIYSGLEGYLTDATDGILDFQSNPSYNSGEKFRINISIII